MGDPSAFSQTTEPVSKNKLISGRLLARNTIYNLLGQSAPLLVAIFAIPLLIRGLGLDRFGVLSLAWVFIGYFSLFDLGLGRALTQMVAQMLGTGRDDDLPGLVWTSLLLMLIFGLIGGMVVGSLSPWLVQDVLKITKELQRETLHSFYLISISIPIVISTTCLRGILEAHQRFGLVNTVRICMGVFTFLGPLVVLLFSKNLVPVLAILVVGRMIAWALYLLLCFSVMPALRKGISLQRAAIGPLLRFGGWMTVTNIVGPLMTYLDRFLVGAMVTVTAVAYYATPYEVVSNLGIIPGAIAGVLFPAFAMNFSQECSRIALLFSRGVKYVFLVLFPLVLLIVTFAPEGLDLWLGREFSQNSFRVLQLLAIGRFFNGLAQIPFAFLQGVGRPDLTAKLHFLELLFYFPTAWWLVGTYAIEGAAIAWVLRVLVDLLFLFGMAKQFLQDLAYSIQRMALIMVAAMSTLVLAILPLGIVMKGLFLLSTLIIFAIVTYLYILDNADKQMIFSFFNRSTTVVGEIK